jgi:hypothetical protein
MKSGYKKCCKTENEMHIMINILVYMEVVSDMFHTFPVAVKSKNRGGKI